MQHLNMAFAISEFCLSISMTSRSGFSQHGYRTWKTGGCKHGFSCTLDQYTFLKSNYISYTVFLVIKFIQSIPPHIFSP